MFTLILQSILHDNNRWADVGKNLIDETPFVWPVLTYKMAQDYKVLMLIYNTACETSHVLKRLKNSDRFFSTVRYCAAYLNSSKNIT